MSGNGKIFTSYEFAEIKEEHKGIESWKNDAVNITTTAFHKFESYYERAKYIKEEFERLHGKYWQCFVYKIGEGDCFLSFNNKDYFCLKFEGHYIELFRFS